MKTRKITFLILFMFIGLSIYGQSPKVDFVYWSEMTTAQRDAKTIIPNTRPQLYNVTTGQYEFWNGSNWEAFDGIPNLQEVTGQGATTTDDVSVGSSFTIGVFNEGVINFGISGDDYIENESSEMSFSNVDRGYGLKKGLGQSISIVSNGGDHNATTNTPTLDNTDTGMKNVEYKVTVAGTQDFGAGDITFGVGDIIANDGTVWYKKVDNNQGGGSTQTLNEVVGEGDTITSGNDSTTLNHTGLFTRDSVDDEGSIFTNSLIGFTDATASLDFATHLTRSSVVIGNGTDYTTLSNTNVTANRTAEFQDKDGTIAYLDDITGGSAENANAFNGELDLSNTVSKYYDPYDLATDGTIDFSIASGSVIMGSAYLPIISDGVTPFGTKADIDSIFNVQYGMPSDYILPEGTHIAYIIKNPDTGKANISLPVNEYNPDTTAPTVVSATIEDEAADELVVVFDEVVNITNTTGLSLSDDLSAITVDSIDSGSGTDTLTFVLSEGASNGDAGNFVYDATNTITDVGNNSLVSGVTAITNNLSNTTIPTFTLNNLTYNSGTNEYENNNNAANYNAVYGISTTSYSGEFTFRVDWDNALNVNGMIGVTLNGTGRGFSDGTFPLEYGVYEWNSNNNLREVENGALGTIDSPQVMTHTSGDNVKIVRDASNIITVYLNDVLVHTFGTLVGDAYLYISSKEDGIISNPTITLD